MQSEQEHLIAAIGEGDRDALWALYRAEGPRLFGIVARIQPDMAQADVILQDVFIKIWHNAARFTPGRYSAANWLTTIARNHALDCVRANEAMGAATDRTEAEPDLAAALQTQSDITGAFEQLPKDRTEPLMIAYLYGESYAALAERYNVSPIAMKARLRHGLLSLREALTQ